MKLGNINRVLRMLNESFDTVQGFIAETINNHAMTAGMAELKKRKATKIDTMSPAEFKNRMIASQ